MLPKKSALVYIVVSNEEKLRTWDDSYIRALRQRTVWQKIIVASAGTLPRYLYSNKTSDVAETSDETTEADSANMVRPSDMEKEVLQPTEQHEVPKFKSTEKEQADQFDSVSEEGDDLP